MFKAMVMAAVFGVVCLANQVPYGYGQETAELIRTIDEKQRKIETVSANFTQRKETSIAKAPLVSSGRVKFKRPDRIHWTYLKPEPLEMAMDAKTILIYKPGNPFTEEYSLAPGSKVAEYLRPLTAIFQEPFARLAGSYSIVLEGSSGTYNFVLSPQDAGMKKILSRLELRIDKSSGAILRCKIFETGGDRLTIEFLDLQINPPLTYDDLKIKAPPAKKIQEQSWQ